MSKMKNYLETLIENLSKKTGYSSAFLTDRLLEVLEEDGDIDYFVGVTMELDW